MPHAGDFRVKTLGPCEAPTPLESARFMDEDGGILVDATADGCAACKGAPAVMERAGARRRIFFNPKESRAAIVTCGGLCPGLNDVIRAITMVLWYRYGVTSVLGLRYGYEGLVERFGQGPMPLTPELVADIHKNGGTILGSSRGPQDTAAMVDFLAKQRVNMLFAVGGDGTQRGALAIGREVEKRGLPLSVVGIPKTIDNDILWTQRTFGFETAVAMSQGPITSAHMEAKGVRNGVGLVRLMGRECGFVAAYAALASSDVNLVLIPEVPFTLQAVMSFLEGRLARKRHAVIVVAEGAGQDLVPPVGTNISGNKEFGDIGLFLRKAIADHFRHGPLPANVKYIDPSYTIRSAPANADDSVFCFQLAENAVHAAMTGRTALVIALWNGHFVHVPIERAVESCKRVDPAGDLWQSVMDNTGQPMKLQ